MRSIFLIATLAMLLASLGGRPTAQASDPTPCGSYTAGWITPTTLSIYAKKMRSAFEPGADSILDLFVASEDELFWVGPGRPHPHSWLSPSVVCRDTLDFEIRLLSPEQAPLDTMVFCGIAPGPYRVRWTESTEAEPGIYSVQYVYAGKVLSEHRIALK